MHAPGTSLATLHSLASRYVSLATMCCYTQLQHPMFGVREPCTGTKSPSGTPEQSPKCMHTPGWRARTHQSPQCGSARCRGGAPPRAARRRRRRPPPAPPSPHSACACSMLSQTATHMSPGKRLYDRTPVPAADRRLRTCFVCCRRMQHCVVHRQHAKTVLAAR